MSEWWLALPVIAIVSFAVWRTHAAMKRCGKAEAKRRKDRANALRAAKTHAEMTDDSDDTVRK